MENSLTLAVTLLEEMEEYLEIVTSELSLDSPTRRRIEPALPNLRERISSLRGLAELSREVDSSKLGKTLGKGKKAL
jgi:hypothetical protein